MVGGFKEHEKRMATVETEVKSRHFYSQDMIKYFLFWFNFTVSELNDFTECEL